MVLGSVIVLQCGRCTNYRVVGVKLKMGSVEFWLPKGWYQNDVTRGKVACPDCWKKAERVWRKKHPGAVLTAGVGRALDGAVAQE